MDLTTEKEEKHNAQPKPQRVLFLDLHGVMLTNGFVTANDEVSYKALFGECSDDCIEEHMRNSILLTQGFAKSALDCLREWLEVHTDVELVLSSAWRLDVWDKAALHRLFMFHPWIAVRMIGVTPDQHASKAATILKWVEQHHPEEWVALDDDDLQSKGVDPTHFVHVDRAQLLTKNNLKSAEILLYKKATTKTGVAKSSGVGNNSACPKVATRTKSKTNGLLRRSSARFN